MQISLECNCCTSRVTYSTLQKLAHMKQGYLKKQGGSEGGRKNWRKRYFVLTDQSLAYYEDLKAFEVRPLYPFGLTMH